MRLIPADAELVTLDRWFADAVELETMFAAQEPLDPTEWGAAEADPSAPTLLVVFAE